MVQPKGICPPANGPCIGGDATKCGTEKVLDISIPALRWQGQVGIHIEAANDLLGVFWDNSPSYPDQTVRVLYRKYQSTDGNYYDSPLEAPRDNGEVNSQAGLPNLQLWEIFARPETATGYGYWQITTAITDDNWTTNDNLIIHRGDFVTDNAGNYLTHGG